jgi:ASC-1-like (ASCH) protein
MFKLFPNSWGEKNPDEFAKMASIVQEGMQRLQADANTRIPGVGFGIDALYNAFTESQIGVWFSHHNKFGFEKLYSDSGGLQIVTSGKKIDDSLKSKIYKAQSYADFAMCFDEIPVETVGVASSKTNRAVTNNKLFYPDRKKECAIKTAHNIREQIEIFDKIGTNTTVHYIIQGNTHQDMYEWFDDGIKVLEDEHFNRIGGIALADTCMGNGSMESIDMLVAYHRIHKDFDVSKTKKHVHLLGLGSVRRLLPFIYMMNSGFLPKDLTISFDSTTFSMSFVMGNFFDDNGDVVRNNSQDIRRMFHSIYQYFGDIYRKYVPNLDEDHFIEHITKEVRSLANIVNNARVDIQALVRANTVLTCAWYVLGFIAQVNRALEQAKYDRSSVGMLQFVKDYDDYLAWHREFGRFVSSNRIRRDQPVTLDNFFV